MLKLLDYGKPNPFGDIVGKPRYLAWPVNAYRVTLPRDSDDGDGLNPFERVVLKLLDAVGAMDAGALADETRIPLDFVNGILLRLRDKAFIDEHHCIIERKYRSREGREKKGPLFITAILFREVATGKILPFLHLLDETNPLRRKEGEGFLRSIRSDDAHKKETPAPRDVISALRAMKRRATVFGCDVTTPVVQHITIATPPELYYLECPIAVQKCSGEFRIADPFGKGYSLSLERAFEQLLERDRTLTEWLSTWKESLRNPRRPRSDDPDKQPKEPFDSEANRQRYPELVNSLRPARNMSFRSIVQIHASLEWALFYACRRRPFEAAATTLKVTGQLEHSALLGSAAQGAGLALPERAFRPIPEGKLVDFRNGRAEFGTVLAIAVLQAKNDESHPLRRIATSHPDLINRLLDIKKKRDDKGHGKGRADAPEAELPDDPFMREIVHVLLPEVRFSAAPVAEPDKDAFADSLFDARASLQGEFGFKAFNRLGANLQERLIHAERFWLSCNDGDDALVFACDLYAAIQSAFWKELMSKVPPDISDSQFISAAGEKAKNAGLCAALPKCLRTVKSLAIRQTLQGAGQTLGSCVIAFLLVSDTDSLRAIAAAQPSLIDDIEDVIARRGHGNQPLPLRKTDIARLRKASYSTIKTLLET